jgi:hypothetical protein
MSLSVTLPNEIVVVTSPAVTTTLPTEVKIERIVDIPGEREVAVFVEGLGRIVLDNLSGDNYDTPSEWSNESVIESVTNYILSHSSN